MRARKPQKPVPWGPGWQTRTASLLSSHMGSVPGAKASGGKPPSASPSSNLQERLRDQFSHCQMAVPWRKRPGPGERGWHLALLTDPLASGPQCREAPTRHSRPPTIYASALIQPQAARLLSATPAAGPRPRALSSLCPGPRLYEWGFHENEEDNPEHAAWDVASCVTVVASAPEGWRRARGGWHPSQVIPELMG